VANYVAGAPWREDGSVGNDSTRTERWVTYNQGKRGDEVKPTRLTLPTHPGNRGCMSQNGADWLARHGWGYEGILRFFYGEDVEIGAGRGEREEDRPGDAAASDGLFVGLAAAAVVGLVVTAR